LSTQTVRRKTNPTVIRPADIQKNSGNFGKIIFYIFLFTVIGYGGYWIYKNSDKIFSEFTISPAQDLSSGDQKSNLPVNNEPENEDTGLPRYSPVQKRIQLEILNGCGVKGIAKVISDRLKGHNYDVVNSGNYLKDGKDYFAVKNSHLIDQLNTSENIANSRELAEIIGIDPGRIESHENSSPVADITIVIGLDYKDLKILK
jgi:hypothetical protein